MNFIQITKDNNLIITCPYDKKDIIMGMGALYMPEFKAYQMPFTSDRLIKVSNLLEVSLSENQKKLLEIQKNKENKIKQYIKLSEEDEPIRFMVKGLKATLYNYQKLGILFGIHNTNGFLLGDPPGLGKTIQGMGIALYKKNVEGLKETLLVVPASLKYNWAIEISKFTNEKFVVIDGKKEDRINQWKGLCYTSRNERGKFINSPVTCEEEKPFFYVVNYELITEDLFGKKTKTKKNDDIEKINKRKERQLKEKEHLLKLKDIKKKIFGLIIYDEIHMSKNPKAQRTQNAKQLKALQKIGLTGTPIDGKLEELWCIYDLLVPGLFGSKTRFLDKYAIKDFWQSIIGYKNVHEVKEIIKPFFLRREKEKVLKDLPKKIYKNIYVSLSEEERKIYDKLAEGKHEKYFDEEPMVLAIRCKQFCDFPQLAQIECSKHSKLDMLKTTLEELILGNMEKVILFTQYSQMAEIIIEEVLKPMKIKFMYISGQTSKQERGEMQRMFNEDKEVDLIIGTEAMSTGLNFQAASYVVNYDDNWSPAIMEQREGRAWRIGQKNLTVIINFICSDTIEERIRQTLYEKAKLSSEAIGDEVDDLVLKRLGNNEIRGLL